MSAEGGGLDAAAWQQLHARQAELRLLIGQETNLTRRAEFQHELVEVRYAIARLESSNSEAGERSEADLLNDDLGAEPSPDAGDTAVAASSDTASPNNTEAVAPTDGTAAVGPLSTASFDDIEDLLDPLINSAPAAAASGLAVGGGAQRGTGTAQPLWMLVTAALAVVAFIGVGVLSWQLATSGNDKTDEVAATGTATTQADVRSASIPTAPTPLDTLATETTAPGNATQASLLQRDLDRVLASTPIVFDKAQTSLSPIQERVLNSLASILLAYPGQAINVVGYTDGLGSDEANLQLSTARAEAVRQYLVAQGVPEGSLTVVGRGETSTVPGANLAGLERRVELEVAAAAAPAPASALRVALVAPSAQNDLAFTQSMVDALNTVQAERGGIELAIVDNTFVPDDVEAAMRNFANQRFDLIIAHGSQFGSIVLELAPEYPDVVFAWGTAGGESPSPNIYSYQVDAAEGGYVLGSMAAMLSTSQVLGVVGPIEVGDAESYVNGFQLGVKAERPGAQVFVDYIGSFSDTTLAAETAIAQLDTGADVLTGTGQMVVGAVSAAQQRNVFWFGNQANQASLEPSLVVASQVYHWEVLLRQVVAEIDAGTPNGRNLMANLANGGLVIEFNPGVALPPEVSARGNELVAAIVAGSIDPYE